MNTKTIGLTTIFGIALLLSLNTASAQQITNTSITVGSTTRSAALEKKIKNWQGRGAKEIDKRIENMGKLSVRVNAMKNISAGDKTALSGTLGGLSNGLSVLKMAISAESSTTTLGENLKSLMEAYRVYTLLEPQVHVIIAADRIKTIINQQTIVAGKLQSRLAQDVNLSTNTAVQASLADFTVKITSAATEAQAAVTLIASLKPDMGDKTIMNANTKALKDSQVKIKVAEQALKDSRKDLQVIVKLITTKPTSSASSISATSTSDR
ncbi:MAG: hypothetical protein WCV79_03430 [Candidatus Paceibacterota bacterium]|jgi:hypothetical protein